MSLTGSLVEAVDEIRCASLDPADVAAVRTLLLDHLAVCSAGSGDPSAASARAFARRTSGPPAPTFPVIGTGMRLPAVGAAMANAVAAHSTEFDDVHSGSSSHPGAVIFPATLAAGSLATASDALLLEAVVVGYEVMCRVGRALDPPLHYARHFHPTATAGAVGAAASAARVWGLDLRETVWALGLAADMAAGSMEFLTDGAWTKRLHPAVAARNGLEAAVLASEGFVGTDDGIAGPRGFLAAHSDDPKPERLLADWRERPREVTNTSIKAHACCRYKQSAIDALLAVRRDHELSASDVTRVEIGLPTVAVGIVAEPAASKRRPRSVVDAQFSMPFGAAVALHRGRAGHHEYRDELLANEDLIDLMDLVECVGDPELDEHYPEQWRAWARVSTASGRVHEAHVEEPKGDPGNPLTLTELGDKFDDLARPLYSDDTRERIVDAVERFGDDDSFIDLKTALDDVAVLVRQ